MQYLNAYAIDLFRELESESVWNSIEKAAERLAYFKSELNMLHSFRKGNGGTTQIFICFYHCRWGESSQPRTLRS